MANITIPQLPMAIALNGSEQMEVVQGGVSKRTTVSAVGNAGLIAGAEAAVLADLAAPTGASLVGYNAGLNGYSFPNTLAPFANNTLCVKTLGAVGNGTYYPVVRAVANVGPGFNTLTEAQAVYPFVTTGTESIDRCAIQLAYLIAFNNNSGIHPDIDLGFGTYVIDADIQGYQYACLRGRSAGTSNSGPPTNGWLSRGSQTTLVAKAGYNGNMILFNANSTRTAQFTGSISGTTLTVATVASGTLRVGNGIQNAANGITFGTQINYRGTKKMTAFISGNVLNVTGDLSGTLALGDTLFSGNTVLGTITAMFPTSPYTGTGGLGTYEVSVSQTVTSTTITAGATNVYTVNNSQTVASGTIYTGDSLTDTSISRVCFRGNWTGPSDATNTTGRAIAFDGVYPIQNCYFEECEFHNFAQDAIFCNVVPLPARFRRLWGRYLGGSVLRINYNANRGSHSQVYEDIQGDYIGGVPGTEDAAGNALSYQPAPIMLDGSLRVSAGGNALAESITIRDMKHEIDSSASSTTAYSPNTVQLHQISGATVTVENVNTIPSDPIGTAGTPFTNAIVILTGTKTPFLTWSNCRLGSPIATVDYAVQDVVNSMTFDKSQRNGAWLAPVAQRVSMPNSTDIMLSGRVRSETTGTIDARDRFNLATDGTFSYTNGTASIAADFTSGPISGQKRYRIDATLQGRRLASRGMGTLSSTAFTLTGWGTGATIAITSGMETNDSRGSITITAGTSPSANPSVLLTYADNINSPWTVNPFAVANMNPDSDGAIAPIATKTGNTTNMTMTYVGTPVQTKIYIINYIIIG